MGMAPQPEESDPMGEPMFADINITPLTDVFLVMVVIFMITALAVQAERKAEKCKSPAGIAVNPPTGRQRDVDPRQTTLVLELPGSGETYIGGKRFTDDELDRVLRAAATNPQTQVVVRADRGIQLGRVGPGDRPGPRARPRSRRDRHARAVSSCRARRARDRRTLPSSSRCQALSMVRSTSPTLRGLPAAPR